jgi:uncharacterized protein YycO
MELRAGQVLLTEGKHTAFVSAMIRYATGSWLTHAAVLVGPNTAVEAWLPKVRKFDVQARLDELKREGRAYVILDLPSMTETDRAEVANTALSFVGRWYDFGQNLLFLFTGRFWDDGPGTLMCSRTVTAAFSRGPDVDLFDDATLRKNFARDSHRLENLERGFATPAELLLSRLEVAHFQPSSTSPSIESLMPRA